MMHTCSTSRRVNTGRCMHAAVYADTSTCIMYVFSLKLSKQMQGPLYQQYAQSLIFKHKQQQQHAYAIVHCALSYNDHVRDASDCSSSRSKAPHAQRGCSCLLTAQG
eukprot:16042-Heterococcus_DN1.PRE.5